MERNRLKNSELFYAVTHEIKNSLNPVINLSSILLRNASVRLTEDENSYLEVIERNGKKILNLVDEFSFLSKLTGLNKPAVKETKHSVSSVSVRDIIDNALLRMISLSSYAGCKLVCDIDDDSSKFITEGEVFRRIIENICIFFIYANGDNPAVYFKTAISDSKFCLISSRQKTDITPGEKIAFDKEKIIEKGFSSGSVMWLQFAALYVYHLKGEVYFSGDSSKAEFSFTIPAGRLSEENSDDEFAAGTEILFDSGREFIMLVIDDDTDNIIPVNAIIDREFKGMGKVYHAESGGRGLDLLETIKPDIILLDLTLPDINGLSLVKNIKHLFVKKNIPVIAFTGMDIAADIDKMIKAGFDDVIKKPFNVDTFIQKIRKWVG